MTDKPPSQAEVMRWVGYNPLEIMEQLGLTEDDLIREDVFTAPELEYWIKKKMQGK